MKRYLLTAAALIVCFTILFLIVEALHVPLLSDPTPWMKHGGVVAAVIGVGLLIADVVLPVPSSLVMVAHGALFGVWWGTTLSLLGSAGAAVCAFAIGRRGGRFMERVVTPAERARASSVLARWGTLAIIVTRPVPLLAETVAIMAGTTSMTWRSLIVASFAGSLPPALLYALTGAAVANLQSTALMFGLVLLIASLFWLIGRRLDSLLKYKRKQVSITKVGPGSLSGG